MTNPGLESLLAPVTRDKFFNSYWPSRAPLYVAPAAPDDKLSGLLNLPELRDLDSLLGARRSTVRACLPDYDDEYSSILVDADDARKLFRNNLTLVFDAMERQSPAVAKLLFALRADLGLSVGEGPHDLTQSRAIVYATPAGGRTRLHFDANANFVVQISGTKRWGLAPNGSVDYPTERYTSGTGEMAAPLEAQCHAPLLEALPAGSVEHVLTPGAVLFVPRGYWHETSTEDDSISITFTFSQPTWADVFTGALRRALSQSPEWRELADGLQGSDSARRESALCRLEGLVGRWAKGLPEISVRQLLADAQLS